MVIESEYDLQETISRLQTSIRPAGSKMSMLPDDNLRQEYCGTVSEDGFRLRKEGIKKPLSVAGRVYEEDGKTYILFWPEPSVHHILFLIVCVVALVIYLIMMEWRGILGALLISSVVSWFEFSRLQDDYYDFKDFIREILRTDNS